MSGRKDDQPDNAVLHIKYKLSSDGATEIEYRIAQNQQGKLRMDWLLFAPRQECDQAEKFHSLGSRIYYYDEYRNGQSGLGGLKKLYDFFREHPYRVVYCDTNTPEKASVLFVALLAGIKRRVIHSHGRGNENGKSLHFRLSRMALPIVATDFFACSDNAAAWVFPRCVWKKVVCVHNGLDTQQWKFNNESRLKCRAEHDWTDRFVVGLVGRFSPEKNHRKCLEIFRRICASRPDARLVLIGDGPLRGQIEQIAADMGLQDAVLFTGVTDRVQEYMQAMDVLLMPSLFEGFCLVAMEAQAVGLQCVLSDRIPRQTDITGLVQYVSLESSDEEWADVVLQYADGYARVDTGDELRQAGYDIRTTAAQLVTLFKN